MSPNTKSNIVAFVLVILALVAIGLLIRPDPWTYEGLPVRAQIIDSETKQPIQGVIVVVSWSKRGGFFHTFQTGQIAVQRTVTDDTGSFSVPGWPKVRRFPDSFLKGESIDKDSPSIYMLKAGYKPWFGWNEPPKSKEAKLARDNGKIGWNVQEPLMLTKLTGTEEEMYYNFHHSYIYVSNFIPDITFCGNFDKFKPALLEVDKQEYRAERAGVSGRGGGTLLSPQEYYRNTCTNIAEWLKTQREEQKNFYENF